MSLGEHRQTGQTLEQVQRRRGRAACRAEDGADEDHRDRLQRQRHGSERKGDGDLRGDGNDHARSEDESDVRQHAPVDYTLIEYGWNRHSVHRSPSLFVRRESGWPAAA